MSAELDTLDRSAGWIRNLFEIRENSSLANFTASGICRWFGKSTLEPAGTYRRWIPNAYREVNSPSGPMVSFMALAADFRAKSSSMCMHSFLILRSIVLNGPWDSGPVLQPDAWKLIKFSTDHITHCLRSVFYVRCLRLHFRCCTIEPV